MTVLSSSKKNIVVDDEGFLVDPSLWDEDVAEILTKKEGIERLTYDKLLILRSLREHWEKFHSFPILGKICKEVGATRKDCVSLEFANPLTAWKLAGLPKPSNIFFTSFDGKKYAPNPFY